VQCWHRLGTRPQDDEGVRLDLGGGPQRRASGLRTYGPGAREQAGASWRRLRGYGCQPRSFLIGLSFLVALMRPVSGGLGEEGMTF